MAMLTGRIKYEKRQTSWSSKKLFFITAEVKFLMKINIYAILLLFYSTPWLFADRCQRFASRIILSFVDFVPGARRSAQSHRSARLFTASSKDQWNIALLPFAGAVSYTGFESARFSGAHFYAFTTRSQQIELIFSFSRSSSNCFESKKLNYAGTNRLTSHHTYKINR